MLSTLASAAGRAVRVGPAIVALTFSLIAEVAANAQGTVSGRVTDARAGQPVVGAALEVEDTRQAAVTDGNGRFRIGNVPAGVHTVVARRIGYSPASQTVTVASDGIATLDFVMTTVVALDRMVVTGTAGGERLRTIGSSVTTISATEASALGQPRDMGSLLNARAAGLSVNVGAGRLGIAPTLTIRGTSSIGLSSAPLLYIDGVRMDNNAQRLNDIAPEDIERIEVIKGPAAATIYGTEASNGVIQLITKRGVGGTQQNNLQVQYGSIFFRDAAGRLPVNYLRDATGTVVPYQAFAAEKDRGTPLFTRGHSSAVNASTSGGRGGFTYYLSGTLNKDRGIEPNNRDQLASLQANVSVTPTPKLGLSTTLRYADVRNHFGTTDALFRGYYAHPLLFPNARGFVANITPEVAWNLNDDFENVNRFTASGTATHASTSWLSQRLIVGVDYSGGDQRALRRYATPKFATFLSPTAAAGSIRQTLSRSVTITGDYSGTARTNLTSALTSATSVGVQVARQEFNQSFLGGQGFPGPGIESVSGAATPFGSTQSDLLNTTVGAFAQEQFGWHDRLFVTAALRVDNNSAFGESFEWITYPKVDASWVVSDEPFWHWARVVDKVRLRAAYGESGRAPSTFSALRTFTPIQGPGGVPAATPGALGNPKLKPERGKEFEAGFDASLYNRLTLDFTAFSKKTVDVIINRLVAPSTGFPGSVPLNLGQVNSGGFELSASLQAVTRRKFAWEIGGNVAQSENEIMNLGGTSSTISTSGPVNRVGYPIGGLWSRRVVSADRDPATQRATNILCDGGAGAAPVACAAAPFVYMGRPSPKTSGAIFNTLTFFGQLRVYALVDFRRGATRFNVDDFNRCLGAAGGSMCRPNVYPEEYSPLVLAEMVSTAISLNTRDYYYEDASFAKLREVSLRYDVPARWVRGLSSASITVAGKELHTWQKSRALDPENNAQAVQPPLSRINLTFSLGM